MLCGLAKQLRDLKAVSVRWKVPWKPQPLGTMGPQHDDIRDLGRGSCSIGFWPHLMGHEFFGRSSDNRTSVD